MSPKTYYSVLGLAPFAPEASIRAVYKVLALKYHPDKGVNLSPRQQLEHKARFEEIQEAHMVLTSPSLKTEYDNELRKKRKSEAATRLKKKEAKQAKKAAAVATEEEEQAKATPQTGNANSQANKENSQPAHAQEEAASIYDLERELEGFKKMAVEHKENAQLFEMCQLSINKYETLIAERKDKIKAAVQDINATTTKPEPQVDITTPDSSSPTDIPISIPIPDRSIAKSKAAQLEECKAVREARRQARLLPKKVAVREQDAEKRRRMEEYAVQRAHRIATLRARVASNALIVTEDAEASKPLDKSCKCCGEYHAGTREMQTCYLAHPEWLKARIEEEEEGGDDGGSGDEDEDEERETKYVTA